QARMAEGEPQAQAQLVGDELEARIQEEFRKDPQVVAVIDEMRETEEQRATVKERARKSSDPALGAARKHLNSLNEEYAALWRAKYNDIRQSLMAAARE